MPQIWGVRAGSIAVQTMTTLALVNDGKDEVQINITGLDCE